MKIKVIAHYEADPSEGFKDNCGVLEICSPEVNMSLTEISDGMECLYDVEVALKIAIDQSNDHEWFNLELPPDCGYSKTKAQEVAQIVYDEIEDAFELPSVTSQPQPTDIIVCVQEYPEDGDQASVWFLNLTTLEAETNKKCLAYAKEMRKAMKSKDKIGQADIFDSPKVRKHQAALPCTVSDCVTLYEK